MKGVNRKPGDPNYDLFKTALQSTAKRLYPNYTNCDVTMQCDWVAYDRKIKKGVIDAISSEDYQHLINRLNENAELKDKLMLDVADGKIIIRQTQLPIEIMSTMGCRTMSASDINAQYDYELNIRSVIENGKIKSDILSAAQKDGRGNICPVTIILPTIAMMAKEEADKNDTDVVDEFMKLLDVKIHEAKDMLIERFEWISAQAPSAARFMYENGTMSGYIPEEGIRSALKHGSLAVGSLALSETLQILIGKTHLTDEGMELAKRILGLLKQRCAEFKEEYKLNFGVYYSPAETLCHTAMKKFKEKYGEIPGISDKEFFTNSMHVPVWENIDPFHKIDVESQLTGYASAGCITYIELESSCQNNLEALETIVNYAMDKDIPYFAINVPNDMCQDCGYTNDLNDTCPACGSTDIQRLRRVTGYITGDYKTAFNKGKQQETEMRVKHSKQLPNWKR
jgi:ribonucleoside-triphosphate reductase